MKTHVIAGTPAQKAVPSLLSRAILACALFGVCVLGAFWPERFALVFALLAITFSGQQAGRAVKTYLFARDMAKLLGALKPEGKK